jgi:hypothetical protein
MFPVTFAALLVHLILPITCPVIMAMKIARQK